MSLGIPVLARAPGTVTALAELLDGGRVLSTHSRVLNLQAHGGRLLALHPPAVPATPFSLVLRALPTTPWPAVGNGALLRGETLRVGALAFELSGAALLPEPVVPSPAGSPGRQLAALLAPFAATGAFGAWWLAEPAATEPLVRAQAGRARAAIAALQAARRQTSPELPATGLLGLGPGGTPSGDDLLVGFLAAWLRLGPDSERAAHLARRAAELAPRRTSSLAAEFYYHLACGRVSRLLALLLRAVARGHAGALVRSARTLAGYGATSGRDLIAGVYAYLVA